MTKKLVDILNGNKADLLKSHKAAKDAEVLSDEDRESVDLFKKMYDQYYLDKSDKSRLVEADGFHPSSLGTYFGPCARYQVYMLRGAMKVNTFDGRMTRLLTTGHLFHERMQKDLENMVGPDGEKVLVTAEIPIEWDDPPIKGHADGVIKWNGKLILLEIKSIGQDGFDMRMKWKKPMPKHLAQANIYAYILGIDIIWVVYLNKNRDDIEVFQVKANKIDAKKQIDKWKKVYNVFLDGDLPDRPYKAESDPCTNCPLREHCWSDTTPGVSMKSGTK